MKWFVAALAGFGVVAASMASAQAGGTSLAQFQATARGRLMQADGDHDGRISKAEWAGRGKGGARAGRMFDRMDANHDGVLDTGELDALLAQRFQRMDANHDGMLTQDERHAARGRADG